METVVLPREPAIRGSFKEYGPWHYHDRRYSEAGAMDFGETFLHVATPKPGLGTDFLESERGSRSPRGPGASTQDDIFPRTSASTASTDCSSPEYGLSSPFSLTSGGFESLFSKAVQPGSAFCFSQPAPLVQRPYEFRFFTRSGAHRPSLKRRRAASDVDGANTASQGCKKRRLRKDMVTSRLSQPFSEPATHIHTREIGTSGDKHFLKVAAILSARRTGSASSTAAHHTNYPSPSSLLRRAAVINRIRLNVKDRAVERGDEDVANLATNAALLQQSHGVGFVVGARFPATLSSAPLLGGGGSGSSGHQNLPPFQLSLAAVEARPRSTLARPKATEASRPRLSPSPRLRPVRSPVLQGVRAPDLVSFDDDGGLDDQDVAFPTSEHESRYETTDELDDVYADFGMIFGGGSADDEPEVDGAEHYEDYMDDMDGIPWTVR